MLRITIHNGDGPVRIQLEGKLAGPLVQEAELCWQEVLARPHAAAPRFDLTGVTQMDAAGKTFLAAARARRQIDCIGVPDAGDYCRPGQNNKFWALGRFQGAAID